MHKLCMWTKVFLGGYMILGRGILPWFLGNLNLRTGATLSSLESDKILIQKNLQFVDLIDKW